MGNKKNNQSDGIELLLLKTANNNYELSIIKSILEDNSIPYIVRDYGAGGHMRIIGGSSIFRTDILVEKSAYEHAKELIDQIIVDQE